MKILRYLFLFSCFLPFASFGQGTSSKTGVQKISNGGLWFEYIKHPKGGNTPTIVFESGALSHSSYWNPVIETISTYANTIRYDRAGLGRSLSPADTLRSADQIARELNELLDSLKITDQIILVCHSAGGFYGRTFSQLFGQKVQALVLIDSPCAQWEDFIRSSLTEQQNTERDAILKQNRSNLPFFVQKEYEASEINREILLQMPTLQLPVFILYGNAHRWPDDYNGSLFEKNWKECQNRLSNISSKSEMTSINNAGHHVFQEFNLAQFLREKVINLN